MILMYLKDDMLHMLQRIKLKKKANLEEVFMNISILFIYTMAQLR